MAVSQVELTRADKVSIAKTTVLMGGLATFAICLVASLISVGFVLTLVWVFPLLGFSCLVAANFAFPPEERDFFAVINFVGISTLVGATVRSIYIVFFDSDTIDRSFLLGQQRPFLLDASILAFITTACVALAFARTKTWFNLDKFFSPRLFAWNEKRLVPMVVFLSLVGLFGLYIYARSIGVTITSISDLSSKRTLTTTGGIGYAALGYVDWMANMAQLSFLLTFAHFAFSKQKWNSFWGFMSVVTCMVAIAMPFFKSARGELLLTFGMAMILWHYLRKRINPGAMLGFVLAVLVIAPLMGTFRRGFDDASAITDSLTPTESVQSIVDTKNFFDLAKTAHIIQSVPGKLPYRYGETYLLWLYAPIPRTLWPEKPVISIGQTVGEEVFFMPKGKAGGGVPPGFVGEMYWNFGFVGIIPGALLYGFVLGAMYRSMRRYFATDINSVIVYVIFCQCLGYAVIGGDFSRMMVGLITTLLPMSIVFLVLSRKYKQPA